MPEFSNPFGSVVPDRKLTREELIRAIRLNLAAEHEAIYLYMAHAEATDHPLAKEVLIDVANEEREHAGEFMRLLEILTGDEAEWLAEGRAEVDEAAAKLGFSETEAETESETAESDDTETTIGSLRD
jgi:rubrerythrin